MKEIDNMNVCFYCIPRRKNALLIRIGVEIVWNNFDSRKLFMDDT